MTDRFCPWCSFDGQGIPFRICPSCHQPMRDPPAMTDTRDDEGSLADVEPAPIEGLSTGTVLDRIGGEVLPFGSLTLLHGLPGSGKSRLALCAADGWCVQSDDPYVNVLPLGCGGRATYIMNEEAESMNIPTLRRMAEEHHIRTMRRMFPLIGVERPFKVWWDVALWPSLWIIDSTSDEDVVKRMRDAVENTRMAALIISQDTKDGEYAGAASFGHLVTTIVNVVKLSERSEDRVVKITKNRYGQTGSFACPWPPR